MAGEIILAYLGQTATWKKVTGRDSHGQPTYLATQVQCRFENGSKLIRTPAGEEVTSMGMFIVAPSTAVAVGDLINDGTRDWVVREVSDQPGLDGTSMYRTVHV